MSSIEVLATPVKSENDKSSYRVIRLENGLKALLISVPPSKEQALPTHSTCESNVEPSSTEADKLNEINNQKLAACSLCVDVGYFSDPSDAQGLAHFLEHLLFMGSEKYPNENEFQQFLENSGGSRNAETKTDQTIFYFDVREQLLDDALDRISYFFIAPLLRKDSMMREREAVDSEFSIIKSNESQQRRQVLASLAQVAHPYRNFDCGNLKTLKDNITDDVLHEKVLEFKTKHYSAHRMYVCVQAERKLDSLQETIVKHFSTIPSNNEPGDDFSAFTYQNTFQPKFHEKVYFVESTSNSHSIDISWSIKPMIQSFKVKPERFVAEFIRHEINGSLQSYLRRKQWANVVNAGPDEQTNIFALYSINIDLTDDGFGHLDEVLEAVFSYLKFLQLNNPSETLFREMQAIKENSFKFVAEQDALSNVVKLGTNMCKYPTEYLHTAENLLFEYDSDVIKQFIDELNSGKFNIMISSSRRYNDQVTFETVEPWYGAKYTELDMPAKWTELWENAKPSTEFALPEPNPFIADDFTILHEPGDSSVPKYPTKILDNDLCELWYRPDDKFHLPTANYNFYFVSPQAIASPQSISFMPLLSRMLNYQFGEKLYPAGMANLDYYCASLNFGLVFQVSGLNQKLHLVVEIFNDCLKSLLSNPSETEFQMAVQKQLKTIERNLLEPAWLSRVLSNSVTRSKAMLIFEKIKDLRSATFADFQELCRKYGEEMKVKALIQGNVAKSHALDVANKMVNVLNFKKIEDQSSLQLEVHKIPPGSSYLRCKNLNEEDVNSAIVNVYQIGPYSYESQVLLDLLEIVANVPLFHTLRTVEQLSYTVMFTSNESENILHYEIRVASQESKFTAEYVDERIENFRRNLVKIIGNLSADDFDTAKMALARKKLKEPIDLDEEARQNWTEISKNRYEFDRRCKEVECLSTVTKERLLEFYRAHYGENERKLSIQVIGNTKKSDNAKEMDVGTQPKTDDDDDGLSYVAFNGESKGYLIEDFMKFKSSLDTYPIKELN